MHQEFANGLIRLARRTREHFSVDSLTKLKQIPQRENDEYAGSCTRAERAVHQQSAIALCQGYAEHNLGRATLLSRARQLINSIVQYGRLTRELKKMDSFLIFPRNVVHIRTEGCLTVEFEWDRVSQPPMAVQPNSEVV
jgi:hypothetical protein